MLFSKYNHFKETVSLLKELESQGLIRILVRSGDNIEFNLLEKARFEFERLFKDKIDWQKIINNEVSMIAVSILKGEVESLRNFVANQYDDEDIKEKELVTIDNKIDLVKKHFITESLVKSYLIKTTAKNKVLSQIDWEINEKIFDDNEGKIPRLKYSTLRLSLFSNSTSNKSVVPFPLYLGFFSQNNDSDVSFTCNKSDIDHLISVLEDISTALEE